MTEALNKGLSSSSSSSSIIKIKGYRGSLIQHGGLHIHGHVCMCGKRKAQGLIGYPDIPGISIDAGLTVS